MLISYANNVTYQCTRDLNEQITRFYSESKKAFVVICNDVTPILVEAHHHHMQGVKQSLTNNL